MKLAEALAIPKGVTAIVGSGGKTSLIDCLCEQLPGTVLRLTTTHCWPPRCPLVTSPTPEAVGKALLSERVVAVGLKDGEGKLIAPACELSPLTAVADYTLIEADGSRGLPLKAPGDNEPVLTGLEKLVIAVAGMSGFEKPIGQAVHRPERFAELVGKTLFDHPAPEELAALLQSERGQRKGVRCDYAVVLNQCDTPERLKAARTCQALLRCPCALTVLWPKPMIING